MLYLDTSAAVKLLLVEGETLALRAYIGDQDWASSALMRTELIRAIARVDSSVVPRALDLLSQPYLLAAEARVLDTAARLTPPSVRSLDAIHLASALELRDELTAFVAYDDRLLAAAAALGMPIASPAP
ncbi:MAG: type II toxin-antitoxin system VapC family toxin [Microcella sp.]|uniref:type II toxin-antitoxin system VapC family toxin n=1 Tax=Microcella sp. TaxID=1913979 RepID=UPI0024C76C23|nr:type II toxin-antitoxin system VapC family toxin [Microcella sp.]UYN83620.1 MAG: type II toxin-antitoxin system VapC family toxin [Microcella sp.]